MMENPCDQVARDGMNSALSKIDAHERVCAERWSEMRETVGAIRKGVEGLYNRLWYIACAFIAILVSALGTLIVRSFLPHP
ncbi:MAG TPA: hypothetical protein VHX12_02850 [Acidisoma sp.]|jgi:hypothetical protein|nr:hypothetical protein [Acidisoma sp.]